MKCRHSMKENFIELVSVGPSRLSGWGAKDSAAQ